MKNQEDGHEADRVGERIARARNHRGLSQRELAEAIHVSKSTIKHYERGRAIPSLRRIHHIALVLRCKPSELLATDEEADEKPYAPRLRLPPLLSGSI
jgi:transcriptional regulator with XRE-family HTH domain